MRPRARQHLVACIAAVAAAAALGAPVGAQGRPREPKLTVPAATFAGALTCYGQIGRGRPAPIVFAPGTGSTGAQVYILGKGAFDAVGRPVCTVSFPDRTTADVQVSVQYLVWAVRSLARQVGKPVAVAGVSQGGLLARMALTYWPSLRRQVSDVVTAAATHHGGRGSSDSAARCVTEGCPPAIWQQGRNSNLMRALDYGRDETPGRLGWTTIRSSTDEVVRPIATSKLEGATNVLIQDVCPGRQTSHLGTAVDSVTWAALTDALRHRGPARVSRFAADVCDHPFGTGLDTARTQGFLDLASPAPAPAAAGSPASRSCGASRACAPGSGAEAQRRPAARRLAAARARSALAAAARRRHAARRALAFLDEPRGVLHGAAFLALAGAPLTGTTGTVVLAGASAAGAGAAIGAGVAAAAATGAGVLTGAGTGLVATTASLAPPDRLRRTVASRPSVVPAPKSIAATNERRPASVSAAVGTGASAGWEIAWATLNQASETWNFTGDGFVGVGKPQKRLRSAFFHVHIVWPSSSGRAAKRAASRSTSA